MADWLVSAGPSLISAAIVASLGAWWFAFVLKGLRQLSPVQRRIVYLAVWLAYFILTMVLIDQVGGA